MPYSLCLVITLYGIWPWYFLFLYENGFSGPLDKPGAENLLQHHRAPSSVVSEWRSVIWQLVFWTSLVLLPHFKLNFLFSFISTVSILLSFDAIPRSFSSLRGPDPQGPDRSIMRAHGARLLQLHQLLTAGLLHSPGVGERKSLQVSAALLTLATPPPSEQLLATFRVCFFPAASFFLLPTDAVCALWLMALGTTALSAGVFRENSPFSFAVNGVHQFLVFLSSFSDCFYVEKKRDWKTMLLSSSSLQKFPSEINFSVKVEVQFPYFPMGNYFSKTTIEKSTLLIALNTPSAINQTSVDAQGWWVCFWALFCSMDLITYAYATISLF